MGGSIFAGFLPHSAQYFMKLLLTTLFFLAASIPAYTQTIRVIDKQQQAIEHVIVIGERYSSQTNAEGYVLQAPDEHCKTLVFSHPNFKRVTISMAQLNKQQNVVILELKNYLLDEVIIHPHKRALLNYETPQKVSTLIPANVQLQQPQTTADLLGNASEVFIQKSQMGGGSPMIRGFSANRILLVVDGVRMNNAIYRSGNLHNVIALDAAVMEQIEVIAGPGSVVYGSDALGGLVHFYTLKPRLSTSETQSSYNALFRTSSANFEKTAHGHFQYSGKQWASITSFTYSDFDNLTMGKQGNESYTRTHYVSTNNGIDQMLLNPNPSKQIQTAYSQLNLLQKVRFRPSNHSDFEYAFYYTRSSDVPRYDRLIQYKDEQLKYAEWYYGPQQWMMHSLKATRNTALPWVSSISILAALQDYTESRHDRRFGENELFSRSENVTAYSLNIDLDKNFSKTRWLYYGLEGVYNTVHSEGQVSHINSGQVNEIAPRYPNNARWWSLAAYTMYQQMLNSGNTLQGGLRYNFTGMNGNFDQTTYALPFDHFQTNNAAFTANLGLIINTGALSKLRINAASGFRAPNIDDAAKVFDSEPGSVIVPNPNLVPEFAYTFEIGHSLISDNFRLDLNVFYTRLTNAMVRRDAQLNGSDSVLYDGQMSKVRMITNASHANLAGASLNFDWMFYKQLSMKGGINWQTGTDSDQLPMRHVAPLFGNTHLRYRNKKLTLDAYVLFNGKIGYHKLAEEEREKAELYATDANGNPYAPAWMTLNIKSNFALSKAVQLNAGIENILNARYRPYSSGIVSPGFNLIFSVSINI